MKESSGRLAKVMMTAVISVTAGCSGFSGPEALDPVGLPALPQSLKPQGKFQPVEFTESMLGDGIRQEEAWSEDRRRLRQCSDVLGALTELWENSPAGE